jgi:hypothetical protein
MQQLISAFPVLCYCVALVLGFLEVRQPFGSTELTPLLQWMLSVGLGLPSLWSALSHAMFSDRVAKSIGWAPSPFQKEIAGANLGIGLGDDGHGGGLPVERGGRPRRRHGAAEKFCHQQCRSHLLVGYPHPADIVHSASASRRLSASS